MLFKTKWIDETYTHTHTHTHIYIYIYIYIYNSLFFNFKLFERCLLRKDILGHTLHNSFTTSYFFYIFHSVIYNSSQQTLTAGLV
jgi:hypothetical protein